MTRHLDPDRQRPAPPHPGFDPRKLDVDMKICRWCGAHVPADELQRTKHEEWEQRIAGRFLGLFDAVGQLSAALGQLSNQVSGLGSSDATGVAGDDTPGSPRSDQPSPSGGPGKALGGDPTSGVEAPGEREPGTLSAARVARPSTSDPKSPPTPAQEATQAGRAGAEGSNHHRKGRTQRGAGLLPGVTPAPATSPPVAGADTGSRPDPSRREENGRLPLAEPPDYGRFTR